MIDYQALRALEAVIEYQSFENASKAMGISQSAITQRIQNYESYLGEKLLIRKVPYRSSEIGETYLSLLRKVTSLENDLVADESTKPSIKIAINRDSLDLYFLEVLSDPDLSELLRLEILADDQDNTLEYLKSGQVDMCVSSQERAIPKHSATFLGNMVYSLVCSRQFFKRYFKDGVNKESLERAPVVVFDRYDKVQHTYLKENFGIETLQEINLMPSVPSFKQAALGGFGYGLLPVIDIKGELKKKSLVEMYPSKKFSVPLYLHQWEYQRDHIKVFNKKLLKAAKRLA